MIIDDKIRDGKLKYDINRGADKYKPYHHAKLINISILLVKKYYHPINKK